MTTGTASPFPETDDDRARPDVECAWGRSVADIVGAAGTDLDRGLGSSAARRRRERWGPNRLPQTDPPGWLRWFGAQFRDPLVVLRLVAIAISTVVWLVETDESVPVDAIVSSLVVLVNAFLGTWQEGRAIDAVAALRNLSRPSTTVVRDGATRSVPTDDVVVGDLVVLGEGDAITADARIVEVVGLEVDESSLTGESLPVAKEPAAIQADAVLADRTPIVHSGTSVTRGHGRAIVVATGAETEVGRIAELVDEVTRESTPLQRQIALLSRQLAIVVIVIAVALVASVLALRGVDSGSDLLELLLAAIALAVAAVPEGLPAILAVVLALGVQRMACQEAIVKRLVSVETLGATTVICTDKTGTLTENRMTVVRAATPSCELTIATTEDAFVGRIEPVGAVGDDDLADASRLFAAGAASSNARLETAEDGRLIAHGDPTEIALVVADHAARAGGLAEVALGERIAEVPFDGERKMMTVLLAERDGPTTALQITKGAPEVVLSRCTAARVGGDEVELTADRRREVQATIDHWADDGLRTLAIASRRHTSSPSRFDASAESGLTLLGVVAIIDPLRPSAAVSVSSARRAGVDVRMITGDHPATAVAIARSLQIPVGTATTGADLDRASEGERSERLAESRVFARVTPQHKLDVVRELRRRGEVVAMTGDGVNDAPALRSADIGISMGRSGTDVARDASDMILTDDDFGTIVDAVREGRQIYENIRKFLRYLLATNAGEVLLMIVGVVAAVPLGLDAAGDGAALPLLATQILWVNLITDSAPALALGVDPPVDDVMAQPPRPPDEPVIDPPMWSTIALVGVVTAVASLVALDLGLDDGMLGGSGDLDHGRTMAFTTVVLAQVVNAFNARSVTTSAAAGLLRNRLLVASVGFALLAQVAVVHLAVLNGAFSTVPLSPGDWLLCVALASAVLVASEAQKLVRRRRAAASLRSRAGAVGHSLVDGPRHTIEA